MTKEERIEYVKGLCKQKNFTEEQTTKALAILGGDDEAAQLIGEVIDLPLGRQSEFSKTMNDLKTKHTDLTTWHAGAKKAFDADQQIKRQLQEENDRLKKKFGAPDDDDDAGKPVTPPKNDGPTGLELLQQQSLRLTVDLGRVRANHARMFKGEIIDDGEVLRKVGEAAQAGESITIDEAYTRLHGDRVKAENDRVAKERDDKLRQEGAAAERKRLTQAKASGAGISESKTALFSHIASDGKKDDASRQKDQNEVVDEFAADLEQTFNKLDAAEATT